MKAPLFTIATITFNSEEWVHDCISSILNSGFSDFELLISDDCSTDNTWEVIQQFSDSRITAWRNEKNIGEYKNRNKVLSAASGAYFFFVDGDDELYRESLQKLVHYIIKYPEVIGIYGVHPETLPGVKLPFVLNPEESLHWVYGANMPIVFVGFAETVFKTSALREAGGFPESFECGDVYIKKKLLATGPVLYVGQGFQHWRISANQASAKLSTNLLGYQNNVLIDRAILNDVEIKAASKDLSIYKMNIKIRDIKLLVRHTFLKGKFIFGITLFKKMKFKIMDLRYLFFKPRIENVELL